MAKKQEPTINMTNRKPFRTKAQKVLAREKAKKVNGTWVSSAPTSTHGGR